MQLCNLINYAYAMVNLSIFYYYSYDYANEADMQIGVSLFPLFCKKYSGQMQNVKETFDYDKEYQDTQKLQ